MACVCWADKDLARKPYVSILLSRCIDKATSPAMEPFSSTELVAVLSQVREQAARVVSYAVITDMLERAKVARPHEDAYIYKHLHDRSYERLDNTIAPLKKWAGGAKLQNPHKTTFEIHNAKIDITSTHRTDAEFVYGVDVVYEVEGKKVGAFQHKKLSEDGKLQIDRPQLEKIRAVCGACPENIHPNVRDRMDDVMQKQFNARGYYHSGYLKPACSAMYVISYPETGEQGVLSACMLDRFSKSRNGVSSLVSLEAADEVFSKCLIGYEAPQTDDLATSMVNLGEADHDLVLRVFISQRNSA